MNYVLVAAIAAGAAGTIAYFYLRRNQTPESNTTVIPDNNPHTETPEQEPALPNPPPATTTPKQPPPVKKGTVDYNRLNSIVAYWRKNHPNATQAEIDEEYQVELWNNTNTA
jgi:hypothetical protein